MPKFFRVAASGKTIDGRTITPEMLTQAAASYDPNVYGARINLDHIKSRSPSSEFKSYGDVISLKTEDKDGMTILLAEIDPTPELVKLNKERQKIYTSVELLSNFKDTGKWYLTALAVTDSPASTHTEALKFSIGKDENSMLSEYSELDGLLDETEADDQADDAGTEKVKLSDRIKKILNRSSEKASDDFKQAETAILELTNELKMRDDKITKLTEEVETLKKDSVKFSALSKEFSDLKTTLEGETGEPSRPEHNGGTSIKTDC